MQPTTAYTNHTHEKLEQLLHPGYPLCKEDVIWILEFVKKKVTEEDLPMQRLAQSRLHANFVNFAEIAMLLIHRRSAFVPESNRLKNWLREVAYGCQKGDADVKYPLA